ncbi:MAG: threonine synthase [Gemmatimonadetes bacterium]|nr:threonine synthase [Gemmatimonadota bacterium]NNF11996.1 threonine synthase [Gemmatimonadota bacterium]NNL30358.1 threonine synthase [Gemmatimonadota bacterium]
MTPRTSVPGASHLECTATGETYESEQLIGLSSVGKPLFARYDLDAIEDFSMDDVAHRRADLWRYAEVLPVRDPAARVALGEGWTPLLESPRTANHLGVRKLWVKDEGQNPTGSFKARGLCLAVSRALELGAEELAIPSAGNAGSAAAAYGAAAGLPVHVVVPTDTPAPILEEIRALGADLQLLDGLISDCGRVVKKGVEEEGWFDLSTLKEPYRVEGKKTMGYELAEQLGGRLPDAIVYPTGGGTGLIGMWKAFDEMERLGWIGAERPKMFTVQAAGCAPMVRAWEEGAEHAETWQGAQTYASGLRVPGAVGDFLILRALRESGGGAVAVPDHVMADWVAKVGADTGVFMAPEGGATAAAVPMLMAKGLISADDEVVLFNTGSGLKYVGMTPID